MSEDFPTLRDIYNKIVEDVQQRKDVEEMPCVSLTTFSTMAKHYYSSIGPAITEGIVQMTQRSEVLMRYIMYTGHLKVVLSGKEFLEALRDGREIIFSNCQACCLVKDDVFLFRDEYTDYCEHAERLLQQAEMEYLEGQENRQEDEQEEEYSDGEEDGDGLLESYHPSSAEGGRPVETAPERFTSESDFAGHSYPIGSQTESRRHPVGWVRGMSQREGQRRSLSVRPKDSPQPSVPGLQFTLLQDTNVAVQPTRRSVQPVVSGTNLQRVSTLYEETQKSLTEKLILLRDLSLPLYQILNSMDSTQMSAEDKNAILIKVFVNVPPPSSRIPEPNWNSNTELAYGDKAIVFNQVYAQSVKPAMLVFPNLNVAPLTSAPTREIFYVMCVAMELISDYRNLNDAGSRSAYAIGELLAPGVPDEFRLSQQDAQEYFVKAVAESVPSISTVGWDNQSKEIFKRVSATVTTPTEAMAVVLTLASQLEQGDKERWISVHMTGFLSFAKHGIATSEFLNKVTTGVQQEMGMRPSLSTNEIGAVWRMWGPFINEHIAEEVFTRWTSLLPANMVRLNLVLQRASRSGLTSYYLVIEALNKFPSFYWDQVITLVPSEAKNFQEAMKEVGAKMYYGYKKKLGVASGEHFRTLTYVSKNLMIRIEDNKSLGSYRGSTERVMSRIVIDNLIDQYEQETKKRAPKGSAPREKGTLTFIQNAGLVWKHINKE